MMPGGINPSVSTGHISSLQQNEATGQTGQTETGRTVQQQAESQSVTPAAQQSGGSSSASSSTRSVEQGSVSSTQEALRSTTTNQEMACHVFALGGNSANATTINDAYAGVTTEQLLSAEDAGFAPGSDNDTAGNQALQERRNQTMDAIAQLVSEDGRAGDEEVYLVGGFREGQLAPEHMWIEVPGAGESGVTIDTMPGQVIRSQDGANTNQPPSEGSAFEDHQVVRIPISGLSEAQRAALQAHLGQ